MAVSRKCRRLPIFFISFFIEGLCPLDNERLLEEIGCMSMEKMGSFGDDEIMSCDLGSCV